MSEYDAHRPKVILLLVAVLAVIVLFLAGIGWVLDQIGGS